MRGIGESPVRESVSEKEIAVLVRDSRSRHGKSGQKAHADGDHAEKEKRDGARVSSDYSTKICILYVQ